MRIVLRLPSQSVEIVVFVDFVEVRRSACRPQRIWPSGALPIPLSGEVVTSQLLVLPSLSIFVHSRAKPGLHPRGMILAASSH